MDRRYSYIVFDMDGTLMDTYPGVSYGFSETAKQLGLRTLSEDEMRSVIGPTLESSFRGLYGLDGDDVSRALDVLTTKYATMEGAGNSPLYPGVMDMLKKLKERGCKISIATMKPSVFTKICVSAQGLEGMFDSVRCFEEGTEITKAQLILQTLEDMGGSPEQALMVGDTGGDGRGAAQAGLDFAAVTWGFGFRSEADLDELPHVVCVDTMEALWNFLQANT
ncbi:MAG: HAD hydrolase-like protein [Oscillospiraceae bacterium]|nr:HAD hydrolase-like protein [Oscillospiraceae bacterium]